MGIQIKGSNDTISAADGSIVLEGATLTFTNENITGISTMASAEVTGGLKIGTNSVTANVAGDDLKIEGASDRGLSIISGSSSSGNIYFGDSSDADIGRVMYNHNDNALQVYTNASASPKVTIDSGGRVGIGTVPLASEGAELNIRSSDGATNVGLIPNTNSEFSQLTFYNATNDSAQGYIKYNNSDNSLQVRVNLKERLRISSSGLVGINTTAPTALLSFGVQRSVQTFPPICFQTAHGSGLADAAISTTDDSGGTDIMMGANVYMGQNGTFTRYFSSYGSAAVRCGYTGNTMFYNKSGNNAPVESMRIDGSGRLLVGSTSSRSAGDVGAQLQIEGTSYHTSSLALIANSGASAGNNSHLTLAKSRGSSDGSDTILVDGDSIGIVQWAASDGTDLNCVAAEIRAKVDGTPGANDMPGLLQFGTTADGAAAPTTRLTIASTGFIGAGTVEPRRHLHIHNSASATVGFQMTNGNTGEANDSQGFQLKVGSDSHTEISQMEDSYLSIFTNATERMRIANDGEVFIGPAASAITDRSTLLSVAGANQDPTGSWTQVGLYSDDSQAADKGGSIGFGGQDGTTTKQQFAAIKGAKANSTSGNYEGYMAFYTRPDGAVTKEQARFTSDGKYNFGHATNNAGSNGRFYVTSIAGQCTMDLHHSVNDNENVLNMIHGGVGVNGNPTRVFVEFRNFANNAVATIQSNSTTVTYNTGSDYRMKENQLDISDGITRVKQLKPYRFNWKSEYGGGDKVDGFFAHEAATVVPEAVQGTKDAVDSNGDIIRQQIDPSKLVPLLTAALKEAITKIETLETKVAALESS